ncbi:Patatin-like phospholipase [Musa troglodytarum]|uniref:Patatin-like phospholipase n=1 Tax=Musa troglodytarum TaxID=320322 RepID=A0A9E7FEE7_9LILI|nr:Patatin-like phospholipase [Musa troglodytarum]
MTLAYLKQALKSKFDNLDAKVSNYFHVITGINVEGIFVVMLFAIRGSAYPLFYANNTWCFLTNHDKHLFRRHLLFLYPPSHHLIGFCAECSKVRGDSGTAIGDEGHEEGNEETFKDRLILHNMVKLVLIPCYDLQSSSLLVFLQ